MHWIGSAILLHSAKKGASLYTNSNPNNNNGAEYPILCVCVCVCEFVVKCIRNKSNWNGMNSGYWILHLEMQWTQTNTQKNAHTLIFNLRKQWFTGSMEPQKYTHTLTVSLFLSINDITECHWKNNTCIKMNVTLAHNVRQTCREREKPT